MFKHRLINLYFFVQRGKMGKQVEQLDSFGITRRKPGLKGVNPVKIGLRKNVKTIFLILLVGLFMTMAWGCKDKAPETGQEEPSKPNVSAPKITAEYFPLNPGFYRRYRGSEGEWEETVGKPAKFNGKEAIPVIVKRLTDETNSSPEETAINNYTNYYVVNDGVKMVGTESEISPGEKYSDAFESPYLVLMLETEQGNEWTYEMLNPPGTVQIKVAGFENIKTPAGTFKNAVRLKLDYDYVDEDGKTVKASGFQWFALGAGLVKEKSTDGRDCELIELRQQ